MTIVPLDLGVPVKVTHRQILAGAIAALAGSAALVSPRAEASPFVGTYRGVAVDFSVLGADGAQYDVSLVATQAVVSVPSEQALYVNIDRCTSLSHCRTIQHSMRALKNGEVTISPDLARATVRTSLGGLPLAVEADTTYVDPSAKSVVNPGFTLFGLETAKGGPNLRSYVYVSPTATVSFGRIACSGARGQVFSYQAADQIGGDVRDPRAGTPTVPLALSQGKSRRCT